MTQVSTVNIVSVGTLCCLVCSDGSKDPEDEGSRVRNPKVA